MGRTRPNKKHIKKKKKAAAAAAAAASAPETSKTTTTASTTSAIETQLLHDGKAAALEYLNSWKTSRDQWRFKKVRQTFLLQQAYNPALLPKTDFEIFIEYISGLEGLAKDTTVKKAKEMLDVKLAEPEKPADIPADEVEEDKLDREKRDARKAKERENAEKLLRIQHVRARKIIKALEKH